MKTSLEKAPTAEILTPFEIAGSRRQRNAMFVRANMAATLSSASCEGLSY